MASDTQAQDSPTPGTPENHHALVAMGDRASQLPAVQWPYAGQLASRPDILSASPSPLDLLQSLRRRWPLGIGLGMVLAGLLSAVVWVLVPVRYEATALIKVQKVLPVIIESVANGGQDEGAAYDVFKKTQLQLLKSTFVLGRASRKPEMAKLLTMREHKDDPIGFLESKLNVDYPGDSELMRVSMKGTHRDELPKIVNAIVESYMEDIVSGEQVARLGQKDILAKQHSKNQAQYLEKSLEFKRLADELGASSSEAARVRKKMAEQQLEALVSSCSALKQRMRDQERQIRSFEERKAKGSGAGAAPADHLIAAEIARDPTIVDLTRKLSDLGLAIREQRAMLNNENHSSLKTFKRQFGHLEEQISEREAQIQPEVVARLSASGPGASGYDVDAVLPLLKIERDALKSDLESTEEDLHKQLVVINNLDNSTADMETREAQLQDLKSIIHRVGYQLNLWSVELEAAGRIKVVDVAAIPPKDGDSMTKYVGVGFAGIVGFSVVLFGIAYIEFQSRRLNSVNEVKDGLGLQVVGELPTLSGRTWRKIRSGSPAGVALEALLSESIDNIRTRLLHASGVESPRVIMVTSAEPREGKTTVATQLATSLARSGRRTLLIDGDVRNPAVHRVFELALDPGLCEILRGDVERAVTLQPSRTPQLWVMAAGRCCLQSVQALSQTALHDLLAAVRNDFEFVIIDAAPVLKLADPLLIGQHVDVALLSALRDVSQIPQVYEAVERLKSVGITVLGTVVNGVSDGTRRYSSVHQLALPEKAASATS